ncbi:MAG: ATP-binding cassette domain-containing protein, partial [Mucilaginibacter sp.]
MEDTNQTPGQKSQPSRSRGETVIHIKGLKKSFGSKTVLKNINLDVKRGENVVILGQSGTGKSVTIQCIVGMLTQDSGELTVFGEDVAGMNERQLKELRVRIGFL